MKIKLFIITFGLFIFLMTNICLNAESNYYFVWENTTIEVPLYDSIANYLTIPKATLYENGEPTDHHVGILWGEDNTDPDYIDTGCLGNYYLTYRAVSDIEEKISVIFKVVDKEAPKIERFGTSVLTFKAFEKPNYPFYFSITDNYNTKSEMTITYDDSNINYNQPGEYYLTITASDKSGNISSRVEKIMIDARSEPYYKLKGNKFELNYGDEFIISNYYDVYDCLGNNITSKVKHTPFDSRKIDTSISSNVISTQTVTFSVTDDYGNYKEWSDIFTVYDKINPKIEFLKDRIEITVADVDDINKEYFMNQISNLSDNCGISDLNISYSSIKKAVGEYNVLYEVIDNASNITTKTLVVNVICDSTPVINLSGNIKIKKGTSIDYYSYFSITDKYDGDITMNAEVDDSGVNYNEKGIYFVYIVVKNSYGKYSYKTITVEVTEDFVSSYYYLFLIPVAIGLIIVFFIIKKKKSVI